MRTPNFFTEHVPIIPFQMSHNATRIEMRRLFLVSLGAKTATHFFPSASHDSTSQQGEITTSHTAPHIELKDSSCIHENHKSRANARSLPPEQIAVPWYAVKGRDSHHRQPF